MSTKGFILFLLIFVLIISSFVYVINLSKNDDLSNENMRDIQQLHLKYSNIEDYYELKDLNYNLMLFFKSINNKSWEVNIFPGYKEFFNISEDFFIDKYSGFENIFYEVISYTHIEDKMILDVKYKNEGDEELYSSEFVLNNKYVVDEPFLRIDNAFCEIENENYLINLKGRAIYKDKSIYKVEVINLIDKIIEIEPSMYGFYAKDKLNKYYHRLVMNSNSYKIIPFGHYVYFVEIPSLEIESFFINIDGEEIRLI